MPEADRANLGAGPVGDLLESTSQRLPALVRRHERELMALAEGTEASAEILAAERLREITRLRRELTESASLVAQRMETMLDRLEAAEFELRSQIRAAAGGGESRPPGSGVAEANELKVRRRTPWWLGILRRAA